jgi:hypothetical protein
MPEYDPENDLKGDTNVLDWLSYFRYILNVVFIAVPWFFVSLTALGFNWYFNIAWNEWWGEGNLWLIGNSLYLFIKIILSNLLAFEYPMFVRAFKVTRFLNFISSISYVASYVIGIFEWYD